MPPQLGQLEVTWQLWVGKSGKEMQLAGRENLHPSTHPIGRKSAAKRQSIKVSLHWAWKVGPMNAQQVAPIETLSW